jgi:hypothetical protein
MVIRNKSLFAEWMVCGVRCVSDTIGRPGLSSYRLTHDSAARFERFDHPLNAADLGFQSPITVLQ